MPCIFWIYVLKRFKPSNKSMGSSPDFSCRAVSFSFWKHLSLTREKQAEPSYRVVFFL